VPDFVHEDYLSSYEGDRFVESMRYVRSYPTELPVLRIMSWWGGGYAMTGSGARRPSPSSGSFRTQQLP
jgi:hypothetical protein